jgi:hypothetical protein
MHCNPRKNLYKIVGALHNNTKAKNVGREKRNIVIYENENYTNYNNHHII